jgi:hypothetical protein
MGGTMVISNTTTVSRPPTHSHIDLYGEAFSGPVAQLPPTANYIRIQRQPREARDTGGGKGSKVYIPVRCVNRLRSKERVLGSSIYRVGPRVTPPPMSAGYAVLSGRFALQFVGHMIWNSSLQKMSRCCHRNNCCCIKMAMKRCWIKITRQLF